jgi:phasin
LRRAPGNKPNSEVIQMVAKKETTKTVVAGFEMPKFDMPNFEMPKVEVPAAVRELAERSVAQAKDTYERMKAVAEETTDVIEDTYATYSQGAVEFTGKALDAAKTNTAATFDFYKDIMTAKSIAEVVEKQTAFARAQYETIVNQGKELQALAQRIGTEAVAPAKAAAEKAMSEFRQTAA